ncbi:transketolase C-terminal domain-containing protein [Clostridium magnum]|uniref:Pyruvate dehydrogenase E1 component subunit beta n=1 Tax=Clostridium magnum DSM 2767 TaxID=1121326 RepID=A0A161YGC4_9CLOT|nr:transketolase C-terminal domain-containing protein [Clostridium magnum]KZL89192.1 pyruvate dehydrogenase E1 component subunit beta [Clostridium magnum DSM 2767]SHJ23977.1 Transketolase, C-terminal domain [Clostridium magnum DSM 2767]
MCEIIDNGKTRIVNNGVDIAIFAGSGTVADAMKASRYIVVKGVSTAVIEVLTIDLLDEETFLNFADKTGAMVFVEQQVYEAAKELLGRQQSVIVELVEKPTVQCIINTAFEVVKRKLGKQ